MMRSLKARINRLDTRQSSYDRVDSIAIVGVDPRTGAKGEPVVIWERPGGR